MISKICKPCALFLTVLATWFAPCWTSRATAASGTFMAVMNESTANADSRKCVTFFDGLDIGAGPLFSVFIPFEIHGGSGNSYEDPSAITVDPTTGDIYILAFDSGNTAGVVDVNPPFPAGDNGAPAIDVPSDDDTIADWDLYRINFDVVYDHWKTNMEGHDLRNISDPAPNVGGFAPVYTVGLSAGSLNDYVTYGVTTPYIDERKVDGTHLDDGDNGEDLVEDGVFDFKNEDALFNPTPSHSNTFVLGDMTTPGGAIEKIGEINRNLPGGASSFHKPMLQFIDGNTLVMVDDARQSKFTEPHLAANDSDYRIIEREIDGSAESDGINGGYNNTTSEAWESRRIAQMNLDAGGEQAGSGSLLSEPQSSAFYDAGSVRGIWVADRDRDFVATSNPLPDTASGDDIAFLQLDTDGDSLGYRGFADFGGATKFDMQNNPGAPDGFIGKVAKVFVDSDTGDLIVVEEGFFDPAMPAGTGLAEPATIRVPVNYDNAGQIDLGTWGTKRILGAVGGISKDTADTFKERGFWSAYDSENDLIYFMSPGEEDGDMVFEPTIDFAADIYVMDVNTGATTSFLNRDGSVSLFFGGNNTDSGDVMVAFTLAPDGLLGDYNENDVIDAADYTVWRDALTAASTTLPNDPTPGVVDESDFLYWRINFGDVLGAGAGAGSGAVSAVPEPGSLGLLVIGLVGLWCGRRRGR